MSFTANTNPAARRVNHDVLRHIPGLTWTTRADFLLGDDLACCILLSRRLANKNRKFERNVYLEKLRTRLASMITDALNHIKLVQDGIEELRSNLPHRSWEVYNPMGEREEELINRFADARADYLAMHLQSSVEGHETYQTLLDALDHNVQPLLLDSPADKASQPVPTTTADMDRPTVLDSEVADCAPLPSPSEPDPDPIVDRLPYASATTPGNAPAAPDDEAPVSRAALRWLWSRILPGFNQRETIFEKRIWKEDDLDEFMQECPHPV
ncbi:hypothetical protein CGCF415_v014325 [Colletotrichum fructicola]|nr:hypothetical protein CGCFRS4_v015883 [Colletotrichum fructicola]KAF4888798.1 hypothetical protein CGCF415_v014325 [Colletotrichum fructicola]KAF4922150.1 hypothetical protein CGCF245_v015426 [Colletotrichum fructicola]KAI8273990.1 hypothetical protein K4K60_010204 [Colletotrichum sp. SAR11_57]